MNEELKEMINDYFKFGGLFNPELMNHQEVRDLLLRIQNEINLIGDDVKWIKDNISVVQCNCTKD